MVIYRRKNFTKSLYLVVQKNENHNTYQFVVLRRDGKYVLFTSRYYTDIFSCMDDALSKIDQLSLQIKYGTPIIKNQKDYVPQ